MGFKKIKKERTLKAGWVGRGGWIWEELGMGRLNMIKNILYEIRKELIKYYFLNVCLLLKNIQYYENHIQNNF